MNPKGDDDTYFHNSYAGCQSREAFLSLMTSYLKNAVICEDKLDYDIIVDSDENWKLNLRIYGGIRIKAGATLTISCEVHMSPDAQIIVERGGRLIVDGGIITGDCTDKWKGVIVEGDVPGHQANSGKVVLQNFAIIENAVTGISMFPSHLLWNGGDQEKYYGGLIEASFATIRDCNKAVEFMKYGRAGIKDQSYFHDVTFNNLQWGVTDWADDGVKFQHCIFSNISNSAIHAVDCEIIANSDNTFSESVATGISLISTSSTIFSSKIGDLDLGGNNFNSTIGVDIQSTGNIEPLEIINNYFDGNTRGIKQNGIGLLNIQKNSFTDARKAIELFETGDKYNLIKQNDLSDSYIGSHSVKNNLGLRYINNCFSSSYLMDIAVTVGGIFPYQGNSSVAAGNCFTKNQITEIYNSSSSQIFYFVKSGTLPSSCKYPQYLFNVTLDPNSFDEPTGSCGPGPGPIPITSTSDLCGINTGQSISQLKSQRNSLIQAQQNVIGGPNSYDAKNYAQCIEVIEAVIGKKMLTLSSGDPDAGKENAIAFYTSSNMTFEDSTFAYGIMVEFGELTRARSFLSVLQPRNQEQTNFVTVQNINLDYLAHPQSYSVSQSTKNQLYSIGTSDGPYNGYARSLYEVLTGERIEIDIPIEWRSLASNINEVEQPSLKLFPNPSSDDYFTVYISGLSEGNYQVRLITPMGSVISEHLIRGNGEYRVGSAGITDGLYFVTLNDDIGTTKLHSKILLFK